MRKLKLQMQLSLDGFVTGPAGEMDWMKLDWDAELLAYIGQLTEPVDCILLGRRLAEGFIPAWESRVANPETAQDFEYKMVNTPKIVFSNTLTRIDGTNTTLAQHSLEEEVTRLKKQPGKDIIVYGGGSFVANCIRHGLIDDYYLFVNPVALGSGLPIFPERTNLRLVASRAFGCGIVALHYQPAQNE